MTNPIIVLLLLLLLLLLLPPSLRSFVVTVNAKNLFGFVSRTKYFPKDNPQSYPRHGNSRSPHPPSTSQTIRIPTCPYMTLSMDSKDDTPKPQKLPKSSYDVIIVGSGIGGLTAGAMLSKYGYSVGIFESHSETGGCAHGFQMYNPMANGTFVFDTGPSFFSGLNPNLPAKLANPLRTVLDYIEVSVDCIPYTSFGLTFPEGNFIHTPSFGKSSSSSSSSNSDDVDNSNSNSDGTLVDELAVIERVSGKQATKQWRQLLSDMEPIANAVAAMPTVALRGDIGAPITVAPFLPNYAKNMGTSLLAIPKLTKPFSNVVKDAGVTDPFVQNWLDLLCFCLSGLPASGTITAEMGMMMGEFYDPTAILDCPKGGARAIVNALVQGIEKQGGEIFVHSHVEKIHIEQGRATGISLKQKQASNESRKATTVKATKAVLSNLSVWDLFGSGIVDKTAFTEDYIRDKLDTPAGKLFMHLHIGFRASKEELSSLQAHYIYMDDWSRGVEAQDNAALVSIPSVHDDTLAPDGYAVLHCYTPATEDFGRWENLQRNSPEYKQLKEERSAFLWKVLEKCLFPDIRERAVITRVGTPLTHRRFLRRYRGSYGPAISAEDGSFPFPMTPIKGFLMCGDSCFPGIGVPAVAASGILAANTVSLECIKPQLKLLESIRV